MGTPLSPVLFNLEAKKGGDIFKRFPRVQELYSRPYVTQIKGSHIILTNEELGEIIVGYFGVTCSEKITLALISNPYQAFTDGDQGIYYLTTVHDTILFSFTLSVHFFFLEIYWFEQEKVK